MQRSTNEETVCHGLTVGQSETFSYAPFRCVGRDMANQTLWSGENDVELRRTGAHRLCGSAGASPAFARNMGLIPYLSFAQRDLTPPMRGLAHVSGKAASHSRNFVQKLIAGFVIALGLMHFEHFASFAQEAVEPATAIEPASGLAFRDGGRQILIGKEGGIFFVAAQQAVRNELGLDIASSIKVHSLIEQYCQELDAMRGRGGPLDGRELENLRDLSPEERQKRIMERIATAKKGDETFIPRINAVFTPEQLERLHQIARQVYGSEALIHEQGLVKTLELTVAQVKQIGDINLEYSLPANNLMRSGVSFARYQQSLDDRNKKAREVLTKEQQDKLTALEGKPFNLTKLTSRGPRRTFGWFGPGASMISLAANRTVLKELGLAEEMEKKVIDISGAFFVTRRDSGAWTRMVTRLADGRNVSFNEPLPPDWDFGQWNAAIARHLPQLKSTLTADQFSRLKQIHFQAIGTAAYSEPEVVAALGITQEQQAQIEAITEDYSAKRLALLEPSRTRPGVDDPAQADGFVAKLTGLVSEHDTKVDEVLTKAQLDQFAAMKGKTFDLTEVRTLDLTVPRPIGPGFGPDGRPMVAPDGAVGPSGRRPVSMFINQGNTGGGDGIFSLLMIPAVQTDLGLNQETIAKVLEIRQQFGKSWVQAGGGFRIRLIERDSGGLVNYQEAAMPPFGIMRFPGQSAEGRQQEIAKLTELWHSKTAEFLPQLKAAITPDQFQRLQQIYWQSLQSTALGEGEVADALAIMGEQKQQIDAVLKEYRELKNALIQPVPPAERETDPRKVFDKLVTDENAKIMALLTKEQLEMFATLKGKEFDTKLLKNVERPNRRPTP